MNNDFSQFGYHGSGEAGDVAGWALAQFHPRVALACSFEAPVLAHMVVSIRSDARIFSIDTGRLPGETYECAEEFRRRFGAKIEWFHPQQAAVEKLESGKGLFSFRESIEARRECCEIRKVEPLTRAMGGLAAWMTELRRDQGVTRADLKKIERDEVHGGILKINPLADWTMDQVRAYLREHNVPYNRLLDRGYTSVGCECCTRAVGSGEDPRGGRWWWESPEHKECGLHAGRRRA